MMKLVAVLVVLVSATSVQAEMVRFSLVGVANHTKISDNNTGVTLDPDGVGLGGGGLLEFAFHNDMGLEFGALYVQRKVSTSLATRNGNLVVNADAKGLQFPVILRFWPIRFVSFGAGLYYLKYQNASASSGGGIAGNEMDGDDVGVVGSIMLRLPFVFGSLVVDGRYNYGFKAAQVQEVQGLVGLMFGI